MNSVSSSALRTLPALSLLTCLVSAPARAEDPLLGRIKVIQCVGCTPGSVDLVVHDPIDVRDFQVRINESDYQKIITPLAGKTVYDKSGCFYWMDAPKAAAKPAAAPAPAPAPTPAHEVAVKGAKAKKDQKAVDTVVAASQTAPIEGMLETSAPPPTPEIQGTPSKCLPFSRVEFKPAKKNGKEEE